MAIPYGGADAVVVKNITWLRANVSFCAMKSPGKSRGLPRQSADWLAMTCVLFGAVQTFKLQGTSKNPPFAIWPDLSLQLCAAEIPQYTKYSGISAT